MIDKEQFVQMMTEAIGEITQELGPPSPESVARIPELFIAKVLGSCDSAGISDTELLEYCLTTIVMRSLSDGAKLLLRRNLGL